MSQRLWKTCPVNILFSIPTLMKFITNQVISCHIDMAEQNLLPQRMQNFAHLCVFVGKMSKKSVNLKDCESLLSHP